MTHRKLSGGYTMIELSIVLVIFVLLSSALALFFTYANRTFIFETISVGTDEDASLIVSEVQKYAMVATRVVPSATINGTLYTSSASTLVLEIPAVDTTGAILVNKFDYVVVYQTAKTAKRTLQTDAASARVAGTKILSTAVTSLGFTYNNANLALATSVTVTVTTEGNTPQMTLSAPLHELIYLRNHI